jgi:hypothetical protein
MLMYREEKKKKKSTFDISGTELISKERRSF